MHELEDKRVLLLGLGILGGGAATVRWLVERGANLTVTDLKTEAQLRPSLDRLTDVADRVRFVLGGHDEQDVRHADVIIVNPDVPLTSPLLQLAIDLGKTIENELTLFAKYVTHGDIVAVTGTRGKTTTSQWIAHLLRGVYPDTLLAGNSPDSPLLQGHVLKTTTPVVIEAPSFLLEHAARAKFSPRVAVITNISQDHLNRYTNIEHYADTKANIFRHQQASDRLILHRDHVWTPFFLERKPQARIQLFSQEDIVRYPFVDAEAFLSKWGRHNVENLLAAMLVAQCMGIPDDMIAERIATLPQVHFRQECIYRNDELEIYNDTTATSPEATIAALERFCSSNKPVILITGGTNRNLEFSRWAKIVRDRLPQERVIFLEGSATELMKQALEWPEARTYLTLDTCIEAAREQIHGPTTMLFSPACKSFEKFKNEFDRGEMFTQSIYKIYGRCSSDEGL